MMLLFPPLGFYGNNSLQCKITKVDGVSSMLGESLDVSKECQGSSYSLQNIDQNVPWQASACVSSADN